MFEKKSDFIKYLKNLDIDLDRFRKIRWSDSLKSDLGADFDTLVIKMPNAQNAKYGEWRIFFQKILEKADDNLILIGHSLGGSFLVKYLAENNFPKSIKALFLLSAPYEQSGLNESLKDFKPPKNLDKLKSQVGQIYLYHSLDDPIVPFSHLQKYQRALPGAIVRQYKSKGHFLQKKFSGLLKDIRNL